MTTDVKYSEEDLDRIVAKRLREQKDLDRIDAIERVTRVLGTKLDDISTEVKQANHWKAQFTGVIEQVLIDGKANAEAIQKLSEHIQNLLAKAPNYVLKEEFGGLLQNLGVPTGLAPDALAAVPLLVKAEIANELRKAQRKQWFEATWVKVGAVGTLLTGVPGVFFLVQIVISATTRHH